MRSWVQDSLGAFVTNQLKNVNLSPVFEVFFIGLFLCYLFLIYYPIVLLLIYFLVIIPKTLNRDHGYPLRVVVPGIIGARSVKWIDSINIIAEECQVGHALLILNFF